MPTNSARIPLTDQAVEQEAMWQQAQQAPELILDPDQMVLPENLLSSVREEMRRVFSELAIRKVEALNLYEPLPVQKAFHASHAPERIVRGGNRCLAGSQEIYDPVSKSFRRVDQIQGEFNVWSMNPATGEIEIKTACEPFVKGWGRLYRVEFDNGDSISVTMDHRVLSVFGEWVSIRDVIAEEIPLACVKSECHASEDRHKENRPSLRVVSLLEELVPETAFGESYRRLEELACCSTVTLFSEECRVHGAHYVRDLKNRRTFCQSFSLKGSLASRVREDLRLAESVSESCRGQPESFASHLQSSLDSDLSGRQRDERSYFHKAQDSRSDCLLCRRFCGGRLPFFSNVCQCAVPSQVDARGRNHANRRQGDLEEEVECSRSCRSFFQSRIPASMFLEQAQFGDLANQETSRYFAGDFFQCRKPELALLSTDFSSAKDESEDQGQIHLPSGTPSCHVISVTLIGEGFIWDTTVDDYHNFIAASIVNHQSGKTLSATVEVARAVSGRDPHLKYPRTDGRCFACTTRGREVGLVLYRKLCVPGAFRIIRDEVTGMWRAYRPWVLEDFERRSETKPAPALIPERVLNPKKIAWHSKREDIPAHAKLENGWEITFFSTEGKAPTGADIDLAWFDEEVIDPSWYPEVSARLLDRSGKFIWSATPQAGSDRLYDLSLMAAEETGKPNPRVEEFVTMLADNPHVSEEQKKMLGEKFASPEEYRVRIEGEFAILSLKVYPEYNEKVHLVTPFEVPHSWCRYAAVDPGHQVCAVLFIAVPPKDSEYYGRKFIYDELYMRNCTAAMFGREMKAKCQGQTFQAFLIDGRAGRMTEIASGLNVEMQYALALKENGVASMATGYGFMWGSDDLKGGIESVHAWLATKENGKPTLQLFNGKTYNTNKEMVRYHKRRDPKGNVTDEPVKKNDHTVDLVRYFAAFGCPYFKPKHKMQKSASGAVEALKAKRRRRAEKAGAGYTRLGPGYLPN